jgi:hypothetical protein
MFENRVLRKVCGPKVHEVRRGRRKSCDEKLNDLYVSSDIVRVIKSRWMRWMGGVAYRG